MDKFSANPDEKKKILKRLRKILALTDSDNPGEAAAALHQANLLMEKYGLDSTDALTSTVEESSLTLSTAELSDADNRLMGVIAKALGVLAYIRQYSKARGVKGFKRPKAQIVFIGESCKAQIAVYAFESLRKKLRKDMNNSFSIVLKQKIEAASTAREHYRLSNQLRPTASAKSAYCAAWCQAIRQKVEAIAPSVPVSVQTYLDNMELSKAKNRQTRNRRLDDIAFNMYHKGIADGKAVELHHGLNEKTSDILTLK